jgi:hypothetical protein
MLDLEEGSAMNWAAKEMENIDLGDKRLDVRVIKLLTKLGDKPTETIPVACQGWAETKAAYRFFDNDKITSEKILAPHIKATLQRMQTHNTVLLIQDTTHLNYSTQMMKQDIGPIIHENYKGILLHPTIAVTSEGVCLGVINNHHWHRNPNHKKTRHQKNADNLRTPIEHKESYRWLTGYKKADTIAHTLPDCQIVSVADREADIYDIYHEAHQEHSKARWLVRSIKNRPLVDTAGQKMSDKLWDKVRKEPVSVFCEFELPARKGKPARQVKQGIKAKTVWLHPPTGRRGKLRCQPVLVNALIATEINPPHGEKPIEWLLLTNLAIENNDDRLAILRYYVCRWQIETFFKVLKSGCKIEGIQLNCAKRYSPCLALYLIIAWRIFYLTLSNRVQPNISCEYFFQASEWQIAYLTQRKKKPPLQPPTLATMMQLVASLGGFLQRKSDKHPGPKPIWIGLQRLADLVLAASVLQHTYG